MSKHTPGPWQAKGKSVQYYIGGNESVRPKWRNLLSSEANARLIAAAPEMLEALKAVMDAIEKAEGREP